MNLVSLQAKSKPSSPLSNLRIKWFSRASTLKYAIYKDGWILYDNTGLKGRAAEFAREELDGEKIENSQAGQVITRVDCSGGEVREQEAFVREMPECDYVVQAVGYKRDPLPEREGEELVYDHESGGFVEKASGREVKGLFGAGIAFPERVVDREGNVEYAVGFWKFMRFLRGVVPAWVEKTRV